MTDSAPLSGTPSLPSLTGRGRGGEHRGTRAAPKRQRQRERHRRRVELAKGGGCVCCHRLLPPEALDFHHVDGQDRTVSQFHELRDASDDRFLAELAKCVVVCATCHRLIEAGYLHLLRRETHA